MTVRVRVCGNVEGRGMGGGGVFRDDYVGRFGSKDQQMWHLPPAV